MNADKTGNIDPHLHLSAFIRVHLRLILFFGFASSRPNAVPVVKRGSRAAVTGEQAARFCDTILRS
jgi:hypothetical protein